MADLDSGLLLKLPSNLGCELVSKWLNAKSLSHLDIAYCNHLHRVRYLELLERSEPVIFETSITSKYYFARMHWMNERNMKCTMFSFGTFTPISTVEEQVLTTHLHKSASCISTIFISGKSFQTATMALQLSAESKCAVTMFVLNQKLVLLTSKETDQFCTAINTILRNSAAVLREVRIQTSMGGQARMYEGLHLPLLCRSVGIKFLDADLRTMCAAAPNLKEIVLFTPRCTGEGYAAVGQYCNELEELELDDPGGSGEGVGVDGIEGAALAIATGCPKLRILTLKCCRDLTDSGLTALVTHCKLLEELCVTENDVITDAPLIALAQSAGATLRYLELFKCPAIQGPGIVAVATHCPLLRTLQLDESGLLLLESITTIIPRLKNVQVLHLANFNGAVNDVVLDLIAEHMPQLEELDISEERYMPWTVDAVDNLVLKCEKLVRIEVGDITGFISDQRVNNWKALRPGLGVNVDL